MARSRKSTKEKKHPPTDRLTLLITGLLAYRAAVGLSAKGPSGGWSKKQSANSVRNSGRRELKVSEGSAKQGAKG